jgi:hypothetical protein
VKLLEAEPTLAPGAPAEPGESPAPAAPEQADARACGSCGAAMDAEQDWCLACGTAAPGRLGERPGWRAAATVIALTLVLVAGSVAAAYAALTSDATLEAAAPPPPAASPVAQAAPATPPSSAQPPAPELPEVAAPSGGGDDAGAVEPLPPAEPVQPIDPVPADPGPFAGGGDAGSGDGAASGGGDAGDGGSAPARELPDAVPVKLSPSDGVLYDPAGERDPLLAARTIGEPGRALDGNPRTSFAIGSPTPQWGVGYAVDVGRLRDLRRVDVETSTPGFRVEVYGTDLADPPPDVTDPRWAHLENRARVGADGTERIALTEGAADYRTLLLWITRGPGEGDVVKLAEVAVFAE